jgi:predicted nucleic acid-binding protein
VIAGPVVVDASVVVEYLVELRLTAQASRLFAGLLDDPQTELWAPDLVYVESASALRKLAHRRAIDSKAAELAVSRLVKLPISCTGTGALMDRVWTLRHTLTPYDACYVALAERLRAPLVTADRRLVSARIAKGPDRIFLADLGK